MVRDPYANYVVQKVIDVSDERQRGAIMRYVKENIVQLRRYDTGKTRLPSNNACDNTPSNITLITKTTNNLTTKTNNTCSITPSSDDLNTQPTFLSSQTHPVRYTYGKHIIVRLEKITNEKFAWTWQAKIIWRKSEATLRQLWSCLESNLKPI